MLKFILKRVGMAIITMWAVTTITFVLMHAIPGDPLATEEKMPPGVYKNLQKFYNLDKPAHEQYLIYLKNIARFDFGPSIKSSIITVNDYIELGFPVSLRLAANALVIAITFGTLLGIIAALCKNRWQDYLSMIISIIGISVPSFIMASLLIHVFSMELKWLPPTQWGTWQQMVMPSIALAMMPLATIARLMRASMLEVLSMDYIKTAKAKGISRSAIVIKHTIKNSILPVVTVLGTIITNLLVGSFVIERVFAIPGMGDMLVKSVSNRDYPAILGAAVFYSFILIIMTLIIDIAYTFIDPRIRLTEGGKDA